MSRRQQHTIREGTSEKHWYIPAGYVALAVIAVIPGAAAYLQTGDMAALGGGIAILLFVWTAAGLITYPALFKDAAYLRGVGLWEVRWWRYIAFALATPVALYLALTVAGVAHAGVVGLFAHGVTALAANVHYLYRRHQRVGVP